MEKRLQDALNKAGQWNLATFERKGRDFDFSDVFPLVQSIHQALKDFRDTPQFWDLLPPARRSDIQNKVPDLVTFIEQMGSFNPQQSNPMQQRNSIVSQISNQYNELYFTLFQPLELHLLKKRYQDSDVASLTVKAQQVLEEVKKHNEEAKAVLDGMRSAALKESTATFAEIFEQQACRNRNAALAWLVATVLFASGILYFVWTYFIVYFKDISPVAKGPDTSPELFLSLPVALSKFIFVSLLTVFFYQFVKNLNSNMHLFTLNRHKANCLRTMKALQESSNDVRTREVVLMQATKAIFELNETGFISSKDKEITGMESVRILDQMKTE